MSERPGPGLTLVVAAAGYGKTTALRRMYPDASVSWHRVGDARALIAGELAELAAASAQLVIDDLPELTGPVERDLLAALARLPEQASVALSSRWPVPAGPGRLAASQIRPADLGLSIDQVAELLDTEYGRSELDLAEQVRES